MTCTCRAASAALSAAIGAASHVNHWPAVEGEGGVYLPACTASAQAKPMIAETVRNCIVTRYYQISVGSACLKVIRIKKN
jgi:hypothetical protein